MTAAPHLLPPGMHVFERGWLSSNNILLVGDTEAALVDSGYVTHCALTVDMVRRAIGGKSLRTLVNTHLHSDHCGGNAALQAAFPALWTLIPPGSAAAVRAWDETALTYLPTGQSCPRFRLDGLLQPGKSVLLGETAWEVHAAPGHDQHSVILFEPRSRTLISADALWENGFGVVFQELEGEHAFDEVEATLRLIENLRPALVVPGHGSVFIDVEQALARARSRLQAYRAEPLRHAAHASKVLLKFKLLDVQRLHFQELATWAETTPYFQLVHDRWFPDAPFQQWISQLTDELVKVGAVKKVGDTVTNS